jgi:hypothetical protein
MTLYAAEEKDWDRVAVRLERYRGEGLPLGLDTEFYGLDVEKESCAGGRSRIHVWSVAVLLPEKSPRGYRKSAGIVLPVEALEHPGLVMLLEDEEFPKAVHNAPVDEHSMANHGVKLGGVINTLTISRWVWPERATKGAGGFGLKGLMRSKLGWTPPGDYREVLSVPATPELRKTDRCWQRKEDKTWWYLVPLEEVVPGHPLWAAFLAYAAVDAEGAASLWDLARITAERSKREVPWL